MTDEQIIKALECCTLSDNLCAECPLYGETGCVMVRNRLALDLFKRQQAEIDKKTKKVEELSEILSDHIRIRYQELRTEAIKEFEDKLYNYIISNKQVNEVMIIEKMTSLKKEMGCGE